MAERAGKSAKRIDDTLLFGKKLKDYSFKPVFWLLLSFLFIGHSVLQFLPTIFLFLLTFCQFIGKTLITLFSALLFFLLFFLAIFAKLINQLKKLFQKVSQVKIRLPKLVIPRITLPKISFPRIKLPPLRIRIRKRYLFAFFFFLLINFAVWQFYIQIIKDLPQPDRLVTRDQIVSTKIYDRHGTLLYKIYRNQNRSLVDLSKIPLTLQQATIAIEDSQFYNHRGFTLKGILRATYKTLIRGDLQGGSTITQQLVKSALLTPEKTLARKIKELILAIQVETVFSKEEILQMYFNEVGYGGAAYGVEEASQMYLGKSVNQLNLAEAALLAGLPAAPTRYSPFGAHPKLAKERQKEVLRRMVEEGYLRKDEKLATQSEKLVFKKPKTDIQAPHFVMYVKDLLVQNFGEKMVEEGGLEVITSLDLSLQQMSQEIVTNEIQKLSSLRVGNSATLITSPATGEILAMVGSKDYFNLEEDGNVNVTIQPRQPGSAIKIVNYSYALSHGYTAASVIPDTPVTYKIPGSQPYSPVNYDGRFHGPITLRTALASSYNVPAVKVLASYGVDKMIDQGQKMGITTWNEESRFGLSLTLGGGEVKMTDLAVAYGILANLGKRVDLSPILEVRNYKGKILMSNQKTSQPDSSTAQVLDSRIAYLLTDILSDNQARTPAFGPHSVLNIPGHQVAVKTGTTTSLRDNWTVGYTPDFLVSVWVGNNDNSPMSQVASGITGASPVWQKIMVKLLTNNQNNHAFNQPPGLEKVAICSLNGLLSCEGCPTREEYFLSGTAPRLHCDPEKMKKEKEKREQDKILEGASTER